MGCGWGSVLKQTGGGIFPREQQGHRKLQVQLAPCIAWIATKASYVTVFCWVCHLCRFVRIIIQAFFVLWALFRQPSLLLFLHACSLWACWAAAGWTLLTWIGQRFVISTVRGLICLVILGCPCHFQWLVNNQYQDHHSLVSFPSSFTTSHSLNSKFSAYLPTKTALHSS